LCEWVAVNGERTWKMLAVRISQAIFGADEPVLRNISFTVNAASAWR
jgi:hypothetical protein